MKSYFPKIWFVILNWNQGKMTAACLESLCSQDYSNYEILVVDNASTDGSPQLIRKQFPGVTVIESLENAGYSEGNNIGIRYILERKAEWIFLLNNDTIVDPKMLSRLVEVAESDPQVGLVGPTMYYIDPPDMLWGGENRINWKKASAVRKGMGDLVQQGELELQSPREVDYIDSCAVLVKREVLEKVGLMNSHYFINFDDIDLNMRAHKAGYKIVYVPTARIWHKVSAAMGLASPATTYYMTRNSLLFFWIHAPRFWKILALAQILSRNIHTIMAWTLKAKYRDEIYRRKRAASLMALRDFFLRRFGKMGPDVSKICYGR